MIGLPARLRNVLQRECLCEVPHCDMSRARALVSLAWRAYICISNRGNEEAAGWAAARLWNLSK
jgi:hypothetical protein